MPLKQSSISDFCTVEERTAIFYPYLKMFDVALSVNDIDELGNLLSLTAHWNNSPSMRPKLTEAANNATSIGSLSLPEKHVNRIAAKIYARINTLTGKYAKAEEISA